MPHDTRPPKCVRRAANRAAHFVLSIEAIAARIDVFMQESAPEYTEWQAEHDPDFFPLLESVTDLALKLRRTVREPDFHPAREDS